MISPSILSADFANIKGAFDAMNKAGADFVHLDVMDGHYVPNISYGPEIIKDFRKLTNIPFDVHLMIKEPEKYIDSFVHAGADIITIHPDATIHLDRTISQIKSAGIKAGIALNPATPLGTLEYILGEIDLVLIMSVNPGFGGQSFIPYTLEKIKNLKSIIRENNYNVEIEVDGGIKLDNAKEVIYAGADIVVAGSAIFKALKPEEEIIKFKEIMKK